MRLQCKDLKGVVFSYTEEITGGGYKSNSLVDVIVFCLAYGSSGLVGIQDANRITGRISFCILVDTTYDFIEFYVNL